MKTRSLRARIGVLAVLLACGCFRHAAEQTMPDAVSFLTFEGSETPVSLVVDGASIAADVPLEPSNGVRYQVKPGRHTVEVLRNGAAVVNRQVYVGEGETFVISVPGN